MRRNVDFSSREHNGAIFATKNHDQPGSTEKNQKAGTVRTIAESDGQKTWRKIDHTDGVRTVTAVHLPDIAFESVAKKIRYPSHSRKDGGFCFRDPTPFIEFSYPGFVRNLCHQLVCGLPPVAWIRTASPATKGFSLKPLQIPCGI